MIKIENLTKSFDGFCALNDVTMHVKKGSVYGLIGPNGSGKTTIIKHLTGIYKEDSGSILIYGQKIYENESLKQIISYVQDDIFFYNSFTVKEMASFYKSMYKNFNVERYNKIKENLNIDEKKQISKMSKGMQKQVAFLLVLSTMPEILILDEPVDGLDPVMRKQIWNLIMQDVYEREMTVLISSHNLRELEDKCDHIGILNSGKVVIEKDINDLKGSVHKFQIVFKDEKPNDIEDKFDILKTSKIGTVYNFIIRGNDNEILKEFQNYNPVLCEIIGLSLEEIFIYELGGLGYDFKDIII